MTDLPTDAIRLDQFLKRCGIVDTGGQAKLLIQDGDVLLNGAVEMRRRHKVVPGDRIQIGDDHFRVAADGQAEMVDPS